MADVLLGAAQIIGSRDEQQDAYGHINEDDKGFDVYESLMAVVADGIGGHAHGKDASQLAANAFLQHYREGQPSKDICLALYNALIQANHAVLDFAESKGEVENCGTTLVAVAMHPASRSLYWISVGDSRLYFLRDGQLAQFTADANFGDYLAKKVARGMASREELFAEDNPHRLTSFLGMKKLGKIDRSIRPFPLHVGDVAVICTDGVYNALSKKELVDCLSEEPKSACERIIQTIADKHLEHQDNATVAVLVYGFNSRAKTDLPVNPATTANQAEKETAGHESTDSKPHAKSRLWLWVLLALALSALLGYAWLSRQTIEVMEKKAVEGIKLNDVLVPNEKKPLTPHVRKPSSKK